MPLPETSQKILRYLTIKPLTVSEISLHSAIPQNTIRGHLSAMEDEGKVRPCGFGPKMPRGTRGILWVAC